VIPDIEDSLSDGVYNARCEPSGHTWRTKAWRPAHRSFEAAVEAARGEGKAGEVRYDVSSQYATTSTSHLATCLHSTRAGDGSIECVVEFLDELHSLPRAVAGLPVGPEASAPLGTVALLPVDRCIQAAGATGNRWMDDGVVAVDSQAVGREILARIAHQVEVGGQTLNYEKSGYTDLDAVSDASASGTDAPMVFTSVDDAFLHFQVAVIFEDPRGLTSALGYMRAAGDPRAIALLERHPWVIDRFPRQTARYLRKLSAHVQSWDWVLERLTCVTTSSQGAQIHLARVLPVDAVVESVALQLFETAASLSRGRSAPVADQLFATAGRCKTYSSRLRRMSMERAIAVGEMDEQRALLRVFRDGGIDRSTDAALRHLQASHPDLEMTVDWVRK
jgi:hypothetical protein